MKVSHLFMFYFICSSLAWAVPIIGPEEQKVSNNSNLFDSICAIFKNDKFLCSGTIVPGNTLITAGHCLDDVSKEELSIRCGCHNNICIETFKADGIKFEYQDRPTTDVDHGLIRLDHWSNLIKPIEIATESEFFDQKTGTIKANVTCITGGHSRNGAGDLDPITHEDIPDIKQPPNMYRINDVKYLPKEKSYQTEILHINHEKAQRCREDVIKYDGYITLIKDAKKMGLLKNATNLQGDSGGPLLCKLKDGSYKLVAINSSIQSTKFDNPNGTDFYNNFSTFPKPELYNPSFKVTPMAVDKLFVKPKQGLDLNPIIIKK
ncbi:MAG: trypsin-like serine protease [Bacteriovoracaceae bacterium]